MLRFENGATPFTAGTLSVPASVPPAWFAPIATVMVPVKLVTVFPDASRALTATAGVIVAPASAFVGWTITPRSEEHTSELQSPYEIVCRRLLEKKKIS